MARGEIPIPKWLYRRRWVALVGALVAMAALVGAFVYGDKPGGEPRRDEIVIEDGRQFIKETGDPSYAWQTPVVVASVVVLSFFVAIGTGRRPLPGTPDERREKIDKLSESLQDALHIIEHIRSEVEEGERLVSRLEADAETKRLLAGLQSDQAQAVLDEMRATVRGETNRGTWFQFLMGLVFFVAGVVTTLAIT